MTDLQLELFDTTTAQLEGRGRKILNIDNLYRQDNALRRKIPYPKVSNRFILKFITSLGRER